MIYPRNGIGERVGRMERRNRTGSEIGLWGRKIYNNCLKVLLCTSKGREDARVVVIENNLNIKHASLVYATFWARNACSPQERVIVGDGSDRNVTQVLLLKV